MSRPALPLLAPPRRGALARTLAAAAAAVLVAGSPLLPMPATPAVRASASVTAAADADLAPEPLTDALAQAMGADDLDALYAGAGELAVEYAEASLHAALAAIPVPSESSESEEETRAAISPDRAGQLIALSGTPHLWVGGDDGKYHWVGDSRALAGKPVLWGTRHWVTGTEVYDAAHKGTIGDPYLSAPLLMRAGDMYLPKWEQDQAQPTLLHIKSIDDVRVFGVNGANYGRLIKQAPDWEAQTGLRVAALPAGVLAPAVSGSGLAPLERDPLRPPPAPVAPAPVAPAPAAPDFTSTTYTTRQIGGVTYTFVPAWMGRVGNDADLFAALILASTVSPEFRNGPATHIIGTGATYRWGSLPSTTHGVTTLPARTVQINSQLRGDRGGTATTITHETYHATVGRTYGYAACMQEEADAFSWEASVWSRLAGQHKSGASSAGNNYITGIWQRSGIPGLLNHVQNMSAYQQQCSRG